MEAEPAPPGAAGATKMGTRGAKTRTRKAVTPLLTHVPFCSLAADKEETKAALAAEDDKAPRLLALEPVPWRLLPPAAKGETEARIAKRARAPRRRVCGWLPRPFLFSSASFPRPDGFQRLNENPFK